jgi:hypothetical protein
MNPAGRVCHGEGTWSYARIAGVRRGYHIEHPDRDTPPRATFFRPRSNAAITLTRPADPCHACATDSRRQPLRAGTSWTADHPRTDPFALVRAPLVLVTARRGPTLPSRPIRRSRPPHRPLCEPSTCDFAASTKIIRSFVSRMCRRLGLGLAGRGPRQVFHGRSAKRPRSSHS